MSTLHQLPVNSCLCTKIIFEHIYLLLKLVRAETMHAEHNNYVSQPIARLSLIYLVLPYNYKRTSVIQLVAG